MEHSNRNLTMSRLREAGRALARRRLETGLWLAAIVLLGSAAWMKADASWYQHRAQRELEAAGLERPATPAPSRARALAPGTPVAQLSIPRLEVDVVVAEGVSAEVLRRAPGRIPGSARPGEAGNVAIAGHRDTFFRALERIRVDDLLVLARPDGRDAYRVEWTALVEPRQVDVATDSGYPALTLITCYPFDYVGDAPYRFVVRARRVEAGSVPTRTTG
ncbi:MAG: sortase family protein [Acidobacteria bacterium]|nr:sortase family protein [Acidobacteriota bacterium]